MTIKTNQKQRGSPRFSLFNLACFLIIASGLMLPLMLKMEDKVLKARQVAVIEKLEKQFQIDKQKPSNTLDVSKAVLGTPCAILSIPDIDLIVPVFYGTSDTVLDEGAGVLEGSSDVTGGAGKHSVLTGHNGLSNSQLFSNLPKLKKGAYFTVKTENGKHTYQVNRILELAVTTLQANPDNYIGLDKDKDYMTLITCTPRYINNKRLLVRGVRVADEALSTKQIKASLIPKLPSFIEKSPLPYLALGILAIVLIPLIVVKTQNKPKARRKKTGKTK
jgi:sortase A